MVVKGSKLHTDFSTCKFYSFLLGECKTRDALLQATFYTSIQGILPLGRWLMVIVVFFVVAFVKMTDGMGTSDLDSDSDSTDVSSDSLSLFVWMDRMNVSVCSNAVNDVKGTD